MLTTNGWGFAGSLEAGYLIKLGGGFIVEPLAQIVYQNMSFGDGSDTVARSMSGPSSTRRRVRPIALSARAAVTP